MHKLSSPRDYSFIAPVYDRVFHRPLSEGHQAIGKLLKVKAKKKGLKVLEVGVGSGLTFEHMPRNIDYTGIDINEKMLSLAERKAQGLRKRSIRLEIMDAHRMSFKSGAFDLVIASSALTAMDSPLKGLKEMARVTKKGGHIAIIANLRSQNSIRSELVRLFDPLTRKYLGFRTDLSLESFQRLKEVRLVEHRQVNSLLGLPLSTYLLLEKK